MTAMQLVDIHGQPLVLDTAHRAASTQTRELASWQPPLESADGELSGERDTLVARSRDLVRNHGVASGAVQTLVDNVIGTGLRLAATPDYKALGFDKAWADEWSQNTESLWRSWAESTDCDAARTLNFHGLTTQVFRASFVSGEALGLPLWLPNRGHRFASVIQLIDTDRLSTPLDREHDSRCRDGVEIDRYGAPIAYWIARNHPGDTTRAGLTRSNTHQRIPARTRFGRLRVLHIFHKERTGQHRGKPHLTSVMPLFKMLDHYERSEVQAAVVNAMIAAFIETPMDAEGINELFGGSHQDYLEARQAWQVKLQGGAVIPVFPGDKVAPFTPSRPNAQYGTFIENVLRHIGAGLNLPLELLMKDFSKTNYASARAALMESWRYFHNRRQWTSVYWAQTVYRLWLEEAIGKGFIEAPNFYDNPIPWCRCKTIGPGRGWIDPVKEARASEIRIKGHLSTLEDECAMQGLDWEEVLEQRAREIAKLNELGLSPDTSVVGQSTAPTEGTTQGAPL